MRVLGILGVLAWAGVGSATPTTNVTNPIADTLGHREVLLGYTVSGADRWKSPYAHYGSATVGVLDRFEVGAGYDFLGRGSWSLKASVIEDDAKFRNFALSLGVMNCAGKRIDPYLVARYDLNKLRIHGGIGRFDGVRTGFLGLDFGLTDNLLFGADYTGGPDGYTWVAGTLLLDAGFSFQVAAGKPNRGANGWQHFGYVGYGFSF